MLVLAAVVVSPASPSTAGACSRSASSLQVPGSTAVLVLLTALGSPWALAGLFVRSRVNVSNKDVA